MAAGLLKSAGEWGADVVVGEGQVFGTTLGFGGPYLGLFACAAAHVRRLPGRLVGETVDVEGRRAYVTTLRAREQDIRREKATSNVCTNQTLMAVTAAIQLGWLGTSGLAELARRCAQATRYTRDALLALDRVEPYAEAPVLREFAVRLPVPASVVVERMADAGFLAGIPLGDEFDGGDHGTAGRGDRAPDPRRDRRLRHRPGQGGGVMTGPRRDPHRAGRRGARPTSAPLLGRATEPTLFELSHPGPARLVVPHHRASPSSRSTSWSPRTTAATTRSPLAEVSERDLVAHFTRLSHRQFSVDLGAYPLGSCTMKYNPKVCDAVAALPGLAGVHPAAPASLTQGWLALLVELEEALCEITGMAAATLQPAAGAAGELTGLLLMRAWHAGPGLGSATR